MVENNIHTIQIRSVYFFLDDVSCLKDTISNTLTNVLVGYKLCILYIYTGEDVIEQRCVYE